LSFAPEQVAVNLFKRRGGGGVHFIPGILSVRRRRRGTHSRNGRERAWTGGGVGWVGGGGGGGWCGGGGGGGVVVGGGGGGGGGECPASQEKIPFQEKKRLKRLQEGRSYIVREMGGSGERRNLPRRLQEKRKGAFTSTFGITTLVEGQGTYERLLPTSQQI